ncbi:MAG: RluA family pseudouridine synthase [Rickettsiales bacterium]
MTAMQRLSEAEINACLLHRDAMILVLNKPAGIAVHVTGHDAISLDQSFKCLQFGLPNPPALAHRLDRGTSGCLVLGRHRQALIKLGKLFEKQRVEKTYRAICVGVPEVAEGTINRPILKSGVGSKWKMSLDDAGQEAVTHYKLLRTKDGLSEIEFSPKTGRTHQIRLHAALALQCPVVGDPFYGSQEGEFSASALPMMLHAETVVIPLQPSKPPIKVSAPLPEHMEKLLKQFI